jgi:hypothetical protein
MYQKIHEKLQKSFKKSKQYRLVDVQAKKLARLTIMKAKSKMGILNFIHQNEYNFTLSNN